MNMITIKESSRNIPQDSWVKEALLIEKKILGTSMNDKLEKGRGTGVIRIPAGVT